MDGNDKVGLEHQSNSTSYKTRCLTPSDSGELTYCQLIKWNPWRLNNANTATEILCAEAFRLDWSH